DHRDLGAAARIARHRANLDDAVIDFGHFLREQAHHELRMAARQENLGAARFATHIVDIGADAVAGAEGFARDHLVAADHAFGAGKIHHHRAEFGALDDTMDDFADAVLVFLVLAFAFCALTRLKSSGGRVSAMMSPTCAAGLRARASSRLISVLSLSTSSTTLR